MNMLDGAILLLVIGVAVRGLRSGFLRQAGSLGGFGLGLLIGASLAPIAARAVVTDNSKAVLAIAIVFGTAFVLSGLGELIGTTAGQHLQRLKLGKVDEVAGAGFGIVVGLIVAWLLGSLFMRLPLPGLQAEIQNSRILRTLDSSLPPAPDVVARFGRIVAPSGFPSVFSGLEPTPAPPVTGPNAEAINKAADAGRAATVKIEGFGCGGIVDGSGFVAGPGLVATNAHVVAGITRPFVYDAKGAHLATVVYFDPNMDFAVLRTSGLAAAPLPLSGSVAPRGTVGAALGFPGGGSFTISPSAILQSQTAVGRNIYDSGLVKRDIYSLQSQIRPGNSGGPLVTPDGAVIGVIFARSVTNDNIGYALTSAEIIPELDAAASHGPVSTGTCAAE